MASGKMRIFIADAEDRVIGFLLTRQSELFLGQIELSTMVIQKQYRRLGLSAPFLAHVVEQLQQEGDNVLFGHTQMFHTISQNNLYALGLLPCGLLPSVLLSKSFHHSFGSGLGAKLSLGVMVGNFHRRHVGELYVPEEHSCFAALLYNGMRMDYQLCHQENMAKSGKISVLEDYHESTEMVVIDAFSPQVMDVLREKMKQWQKDKLHTVNLLLNCSDPSAIAGYRALAAAGYFFTGFQPASESGEYIILHHPMAVPVVFKDMVVSHPFAGVVSYIQEKYMESWGENE